MAGWLRRTDPWLLAALGVALFLRAGLLILYFDLEGRGDETVHYVLGVLTSNLGPDAITRWAPGFEFFQAGAYRIFGPEPWAAKALEVVVSTATVGLVYAMAHRLGGVRPARIAAFLLAFHPTHVAYSHYMYTETLFVFLLGASLHAFYRTPTGPTRRDLVVSGVLFGLTALTRSVILRFVPLWIIWALVRGRRREAVQVLVMVALALVVISPWTIRNYQKYDRFVLVDPIAGLVAHYAFNADTLTRDLGYRQKWSPDRQRCPAPALLDHEPFPPVSELYRLFPPSGEKFLTIPERLRHQIHTMRMEAAVDLPAMADCEVEKGLAYARERPLHILGLTLRRLYAYWGPNSLLLRYVHTGSYEHGPLREENYPILKWMVVLSTVALFSLAVLYFGIPQIPPIAEWLALLTAYYTALHMVASAWSRYRFPLDIFAVVLAALWISRPGAPVGRWRRLAVGTLLLLYGGLAVHYLVFTLP